MVVVVVVVAVVVVVVEGVVTGFVTFNSSVFKKCASNERQKYQDPTMN